MSNPTISCPFCNEEMQRGSVLGESYALKWQPADKAQLLGLWSTGHKIGETGMFSRAMANGFRCAACEKIIVDG